MSPQKRAADFTQTEVEKLLRPFERFQHLALAVSGGADSTALMLLAKRWRGNAKLSVLTIDHALRPESRREAREVTRLARHLGFAACLLTWKDRKPATGLQARAREARYRLMAGWCAAHGAQGVVTAHTLDDQAETLLMRLARGSGIDGLAAMGAETTVYGVRVLRPLLDVPRARLRGFVVASGHAFFDDPSNANPAFERIRIRQAAPQLAALGLTANALALSARRLNRARRALDHATDAAERAAVDLRPQGHAVVKIAWLTTAAEEIRLRLLGRLIERIGGASRQPELGEIERLGQWLAANGGGARTLGGCRLQKRGDALIVGREWGRMSLPPVRIEPGETLVWDDRFRVRLAATSSGGLDIVPLGKVTDRKQVKRPKDLPDFVFRTLPALLRHGRVVLVPQIGYSGPRSGDFRAEVLPLAQGL